MYTKSHVSVYRTIGPSWSHEMAYFCSRDDSSEDSRTQTDVLRAIPLVGPKRYSDVLRMSTTSKITGTPVSKVYFD